MLIGLDGNEANVKNKVGSGIYAFEMLGEFSQAKGLSSSGRKNHKFLIYLKDKPLPDLPKETANFKYLVFGPKKLWTRFALPIKLAFGPKIDIFFTLGHYGPHFSKVPYAVTIFDLSYLRYPELFKKSDLYQLTNWSKYSIRTSRHIFTISKSSKQDIIKNYNVNPTKITVTYPGFDQKRFKLQPKGKIEAIKKKYKISGDYLIFVGTLQPRKNIERLIEAFAILIHDTKYMIHDIQLVIAGRKGWLYDSIFAKVKGLGLDKKIIFTGYVLDDDLPALIAGANVYVLPSLWEGFGIPVIEAQACGVPVVVSNTSSLPEIVIPPPVILSEAKNLNVASAILVNPESVDLIAQGIIKVLTDSQTRSDLVKAGFVNIKRFSWKKCAGQTLEVLEKLASNKAP